jgi:hypothetical protein
MTVKEVIVFKVVIPGRKLKDWYLPSRQSNDRAISAMAPTQSSTPPKSRPWRTVLPARNHLDIEMIKQAHLTAAV